ncbi:hypothetical protein FEM48_Zijuj02G0067500 [Ziziphus jujuba var. spinosa]|uniref:Elongin-C n=1 Tax=Ziziphus jujuba var. spinosa TaxID=714518 RepID=A0A978VU87_ZIZJJ|nr:hypothetical protein FEM48_Zijuj02G0067500 [Ziziphus jujuba var. spinosa]
MLGLGWGKEDEEGRHGEADQRRGFRIRSFAETEHGEVTFPEISTTILEKICKYFYWNLQFARIWCFCSGKETEFHIEPELTLELMMAANYLHT